jgi:hypothetical protein
VSPGEYRPSISLKNAVASFRKDCLQVDGILHHRMRDHVRTIELGSWLATIPMHDLTAPRPSRIRRFDLASTPEPAIYHPQQTRLQASKRDS